MKRMLYVGILVVGLPFLGGCSKQGKFEQPDLSSLEQGFESRQTIDDVTISVKRLTQKDREYVFGKKTLSHTPILLTIENRSEHAFLLDTEKLPVIEVEYGYRKAAADDSGTSYKIMAAGAGLYGASWIGALFSVLANSRDCIVEPFLYPACVGVGLIVYGLVRLIIKANRCDKVYRISFVKKLNYPIEQKKRVSLLLFFEKNMVPDLLPVKFEMQTKPAQTLNFELSTNRASQANEFIHKTV